MQSKPIPPENGNDLNKIARLLALLVIKGIEDKQEHAVLLSKAGFSASDIADLLHVGKNYVNVALHRHAVRARKSSAKKRRV